MRTGWNHGTVSGTGWRDKQGARAPRKRKPRSTWWRGSITICVVSVSLNVYRFELEGVRTRRHVWWKDGDICRWTKSLYVGVPAAGEACNSTLYTQLMNRQRVRMLDLWSLFLPLHQSACLCYSVWLWLPRIASECCSAEEIRLK